MLQASACACGAAVAGNAFIGKAAMAWFRSLTAPRWQLPLPAFLVVGGLYYGIVGYVLARSIDRRDAGTTAWSLPVLVGNEAWNVAASAVGALVPVLSACAPPSSPSWRSGDR